MLESWIVLQIRIRSKADGCILAEIVFVDKRIVVGDRTNVRALTALESGRLALFKSIKTILAVWAEIHPVCPYIPISDRNSFFSTRFGAFKTG